MRSATPLQPRFPFAIVFLVLLTFVLTTTLITFILPELYSSTTRIRVERDDSDIVGLAERKVVPGYDPYFIQTEFEVIQSEVILGKVVEDLDLNNEWGNKYANGQRLKTPESLVLLKGRIDLRPVRNTSLIEIRATSDKPEEAAKLANAIAAAYQNYRRTDRADKVKFSIGVLEHLYEQNNQKERELRAEIAELSRPQGNPDSNRLAEASMRLDGFQRIGQMLFMKMAVVRTDADLPATGMVQILDTAVPGLRPVRPNKPLNIALGFVLGTLCGLFLATAVYALQWRAFRRAAGVPRTPFPPRFRTFAHVLIALVVGTIVGYHTATPLQPSTFLVVPLILLLGVIGSAYIEFARPSSYAAPTVATATWREGAAPEI